MSCTVGEMRMTGISGETGVAEVSREYLHLACHPDTGLFGGICRLASTAPQVSGTVRALRLVLQWCFYRTMANRVGLAVVWKRWMAAWDNDIFQKFYCAYRKTAGMAYFFYWRDKAWGEGTASGGAVIGVNAQASWQQTVAYSKECVENFGIRPLRKGSQKRYLWWTFSIFSTDSSSGNYRIW